MPACGAEQSTFLGDESQSAQGSTDTIRSHFNDGFWTHTYDVHVDKLAELRVLLSNIPQDCDLDLYLDRISDKGSELLVFSEEALGVQEEKIVTLLAPGDYRLRVRNHTETWNDPDTYTLSRTSLNLDTLPARPIAQEQIQETMSHATTEERIRVFQLPTSTSYFFVDIEPKTRTIDAFIFDSNGRVVAQNDAENRLGGMLWGSAPYFLVLQHPEGEWAPNNITIQTFVRELSVMELEFNLAQTASFTSGERSHFYQLVDFPQWGDGFRVVLSNIPEGSDYDLLMYSANGDLIDYSQRALNNNELITHAVDDPSEPIMIEVFDYSNKARKQPYHIVVTSNDAQL